MAVVAALLAIVSTLAMASRAEAYIYWTDRSPDTIGRANLDGSGVDPDFWGNKVEPNWGVAVNDSHIYSTNRDGEQITRANLDGSGAAHVLSAPDPHSPLGIAIDPDHLYWPWTNGIGRAGLDGSSPDPEFIAETCTYLVDDVPVTQACDPERDDEIARFLPTPHDVATDAGHIYWTDSSTIARADLDGSNPDLSFIGGASSPVGIAVDANHIYWTNTGTNTIGRAGLDGSNVDQSFITGADNPRGVAVDDDHIYWTNRGTNTIGRADLDGSNANQSFIADIPTVFGAPSALFDIEVDGLGVYPPATGTTERVSVDSSGNQADNSSGEPGLSSDGRYVAFSSSATNLIPGGSSNDQIFVHDRQTDATELVSVNGADLPGNDESFSPAISANGRYVAFTSRASNLVGGDTNNKNDVFVYDRQTGATERVSVDSAGNQGNDPLGNQTGGPSSISADGRYVAFMSAHSDLVPADTNDSDDVFVHDRETGTTERVSVDSAEGQADSSSGSPSISADGRYVAFDSTASNLMPSDSNGSASDIFVRDRQTGDAELVSVDSVGTQGDLGSLSATISAGGRYLSFSSRATNLVSGDTNGSYDIFVHDRQTGGTERVSVDSAGNQANGGDAGFRSGITANGRWVVFDSGASNLVDDDTNGAFDVFLHDRQTGETRRVSVDGTGAQGNSFSEQPRISADGRFVAYGSMASNLVPGDTNGTADVFVHEPAVNFASEFVEGPVTVSTNTTTSPGDPIGTSVTTPILSGTVTIVEGATTTPNPSGFSLLGQEVQITAPNASPTEPLVVLLRIDDSLLPPGANETNLEVFRNGALVAECHPGAGTSASPDPCVAGRTATTSGVELTVRASQASTWNFGLESVPPETTITSGTQGATNDPTPTFSFSSSEAGSTFQCKVDSTPYAACASPRTTARLADGSHTFYVRAMDAAGNVDPTPATRTFTVRTAEVRVSGSTLIVTAAAGAEDNLSITRPSASTLRVTDFPSGPYTGSGVHTGAGCIRTGDYAADCAASGITLIQVSSADQTDKVTNSTAVRSSLNGGSADDVLTGGSANDALTGGSGADIFRGMNGNDQLFARDLSSDTTINCDAGNSPGGADRAELDLKPRDPDSVVAGCETKTRR